MTYRKQKYIIFARNQKSSDRRKTAHDLFALKSHVFFYSLFSFMENLHSETTSQNKYTSPVKLIASLVAVALAIGFGYYTYASSPSLTLEEIEMRKTAQMLQAQTQVDMDNLKTLSDCHEIAERESKYPEQYLSIRETCYQNGKKPDIVGDKVSKLYS